MLSFTTDLDSKATTKQAITDDLPQPAKRVKIGQSTAFSDNEVSEQCVTDFIENGIDETKWITGKFKMVYPITDGKLDAIAVIYSSNAQQNGHVIPIIFQLSPRLLTQLDISPLNEFRLLLRGARVDEMQRRRHTCTLPLQLIYSSHVHILWKPRQPELSIKTLNTWQATMKPTNADNAWYSSGGEEELLKDEALVNSPRKRRSLEPPIVDMQPDLADTREYHNAKQNKKRQRLEAKRQKKEAAAEAVAAYDVQPHDSTSNALVDSVITVSSKHLDNLTIRPSVSPSETLKLDTSSVLYVPEESNRQESASRGFSRYPHISKVRADQRAHVSGVVVDVSNEVTKTRTGEWMCYITIIDQDSMRSNASGKWNGLKINCFTKRHKEWLPYLKRGDVVILHDVKIEDYMGNIVGVGQHDRLRWAAYSPTAGEIYYGPPNNTPREEKLAGGFGASFSPFYETDEADIQHCISLSDWWKKILEKDLSESVVPISKGNGKRLHRLLSETGPNVPPSGYFDCTVEVLKLFTTPQGVHSLFVTDYTPSPGSGSGSKTWSASLNDCVVQLEMWDEAAQIAEATMKPGEYYSIKNARMRLNNSGYLEGKVSEGKITQLDENDVESDIHLKALLKRKEEWSLKHNTDIDSFQLIQDAQVGRFFDCVVELLHVESRPHHMPKLYVTDYSGKSGVAATCGDEIWSCDLEGRVVKIVLDDEQKNIAQSATPGTILSVRKLRLKLNTVENGICGILGGSEKLIVPININRTDNDRLNDLVRRKEEWANNRQKHNRQPDNSNKRGSAYTRIRDMPLQDTDVDRYQIVATVVDFYPLELKDAFYQKCSSCNKEIPKKQKACIKCEDFDHEFVRYCYQMFILIEDEVGDQIKLSINDKCSLFDGLKRAHLVEDNSALRAFSTRVKPLLGDLFATHDGLKTGTVVEVEKPLLSFEIDTWIFLEGSKKARAFSLSTFV